MLAKAALSEPHTQQRCEAHARKQISEFENASKPIGDNQTKTRTLHIPKQVYHINTKNTPEATDRGKTNYPQITAN